MLSNAQDPHLTVSFATSRDKNNAPLFLDSAPATIPADCSPATTQSDHGFTIYKVPMNQSPLWVGDIQAIKINPSRDSLASGDTIAFEYIHLTPTPLDCSGKAPPSDFSLFVSPLGALVTQGGSVSFNVDVTQTGTPQTVMLSVPNPPTGTTVSFSPPSVSTVRDRSTLTVATSNTTPLGDAFFDINGTAGGTTHSLKQIGVSVKSGGGNACNTITGLPKVSALALNAGELWASGQGKVFVIDTTTLSVQTISIPGFSDNLIGKIGFDNGNAYIPIGNGTQTGNQLVVIDAVNKPHSITGQLSIDRLPSAVIPFGNLLYVTRSDTPATGSNTLDIVNPTNVNQPVIQTIVVGSGTSDMVVDPQTALGYALNVADRSITVIDLAGRNAVQTIQFPQSLFSLGAGALNFYRGRLYLASAVNTSPTAAELLIIDPRNNNTTLAQIDLTDVSNRPAGITTSGNLAFVTGEFGNNVAAINLGTNKVMTTISTGANPAGIVADPDSGNVYIANIADGSISVVCAAQTVPLAASLAFDPPVVKMGSSATIALQLTGPSPGFSAASFSSSVPPGSITNAHQSQARLIEMAASSPVTFASIDVPMGANSTNVAFAAPSVTAPTSIDISGVFNGTSQTATLMVLPAPLANPSASSIDFGSQIIGTSVTKPIQIINSGSLPLNISNIGLSSSGDFQESDMCGSTLAVGASCDINVILTPHTTGLLGNSVNITDDADDSPQHILLSANGIDFALGLSPNSPSAQTVTAGQTAIYHLSLAGLAGFTGTISLSCGGLPQQSQCSFSLPQVSINDALPVPVDMSVFTTATNKTSGGLMSETILRRPNSGTFFVAGLCGLLVISIACKRRKTIWMLSVAVVIVSLSLSSCGGGNSPPPKPGTPAGTSTIVVTGATGNASRTVNVTLTVQ